MRPYTEAPPQGPSTDGDRPPPQRVFGHAEPDRRDDQNHVGDTVEGRTADPAQPEAQRYPDEQTDDQREHKRERDGPRVELDWRPHRRLLDTEAAQERESPEAE